MRSLLGEVEYPDSVYVFRYGGTVLRFKRFEPNIGRDEPMETPCMFVAIDASQFFVTDSVAQHLGYCGLLTVEEMSVDDAIALCRFEALEGLSYYLTDSCESRVIYC